MSYRDEGPAKPFKYKPGPVGLAGFNRRSGGRVPKLWVGFDEQGRKSRDFPRVWRYELGGSVERRATDFEAFDAKHKSLGAFETLTAACVKVESIAAAR